MREQSGYQAPRADPPQPGPAPRSNLEEMNRLLAPRPSAAQPQLNPAAADGATKGKGRGAGGKSA
eukprot:9753051-Alexandrium_andersonii.AAC.1